MIKSNKKKLDGNLVAHVSYIYRYIVAMIAMKKSIK